MATLEAHSSQRYIDMRNRARRVTKRLGIGLGLIVVLMIALAIAGGTFLRGFGVGVLTLIVVAMAGWAVAVWRKAKTRVSPPLDPPMIPTGPWDYDMTAHQLDGPSISFSKFAGGVLVLNFWVPWHSPCMLQLPSLQRLRERTSDLGVQFACVTRDGDSAVREFLDLRKAKPSLPLYVLDGDLPEQFRGRIMPTTFVLDRAGAIALRQVGAAAWDHESVVTFVRGLAAGPPVTRPVQ